MVVDLGSVVVFKQTGVDGLALLLLDGLVGFLVERRVFPNGIKGCTFGNIEVFGKIGYSFAEIGDINRFYLIEQYDRLVIAGVGIGLLLDVGGHFLLKIVPITFHTCNALEGVRQSKVLALLNDVDGRVGEGSVPILLIGNFKDFRYLSLVEILYLVDDTLCLRLLFFQLLAPCTFLLVALTLCIGEGFFIGRFMTEAILG